MGTGFGGLGELKPWRVAVSLRGAGRLEVGLGRTGVQASVFRTSAVRHGQASRRIYGRDGSKSEGEKRCVGRNPPDQAESSYTTAWAPSLRGALLHVGQRVTWLDDLQKRPAKFQRIAALRVSQKSEVADLDETGRQHMDEKPPDKLDGVQRHEFGLVAVGRVSPAESDPAILHGNQSSVGNSNPVGVAGQVLKDLFGSAKWLLNMDYPVLVVELVKEAIEFRCFLKAYERAGKAQFLVPVGAAEQYQEGTAEAGAEHLAGQEKRG